MLGSSYEGFTVVMALVNPHPALKVAAPMSPMVDGWMGDDWFHFGAFRQPNFDYIAGQTVGTRRRQHGHAARRLRRLRELPARRLGRRLRQGRTASSSCRCWRKMAEHPAYDAFWQEQALDKVMAAQPLTVPTMWIQGIWDQEDMWGAIQTWLTVEPKDTHQRSQLPGDGPVAAQRVNYDGTTLGPLQWDGDTALQFRRDVLKPFFDQYLKDGRAARPTRRRSSSTTPARTAGIASSAGRWRARRAARRR